MINTISQSSPQVSAQNFSLFSGSLQQQDKFRQLASKAETSATTHHPALTKAIVDYWRELQIRHHPQARSEALKNVKDYTIYQGILASQPGDLNILPYITDAERNFTLQPHIRNVLMSISDTIIKTFFDANYIKRDEMITTDEKGELVRLSSEKADAVFKVIDLHIQKAVRKIMPGINFKFE